MDLKQYDSSSNWEQTTHTVKSTDAANVAKYITTVYGWMVLGLTLTGLTAFLFASNQALMNMLLGNKMVLFGAIIAQFALVGYLMVRLQKMTSLTATLVFLGYSLLNGITFSIILLAYSPQSLLTVFGITAGTFAVMTAVGYFTQQDLTSFGKLMMMGLIGIIIASLVNWFVKSPTLYWIISYVGVAVFVGLIAYDTQKIKSYAYLESEEDRKKGAIIGALNLYLDFINLFIMLLRLFGRRD